MVRAGPALSLQPRQFRSWRLFGVTGGSLEDLLRTVPVHEIEIRASGWAGSLPQI